MKNFTLALMFVLGLNASVFSQTLLNENFNYKAGVLTSANTGANVSGGNWTSFSGTGFNVNVNASNLSYTGYGSSGIGNSIGIVGTTASAEDVYRAFATQTAGTIYCAMLINVTDTVGLSLNSSVTGDYFAGLLQNSNTTSFVSRLSIRKGASGNTFQLGMKANTSATAAFSSINLDINTTHLIVISYSIKTGTNNDSSMLWINPSTSTMPVADITNVITAGGDAADITRVFIRQGSAGTPNAQIDGIHVGLSWGDIMGTGLGIVAPVSGSVSTPGLTYGSYTFTKPGDYNPATMQILGFLKKSTTTTIGTPTWPVSNYTPNADFTQNGTLYQNDTLSKCVYSGDTNYVAVSGLTTGTAYYMTFLVIRTTDTIYSTASTVTMTTQVNKPNTIPSYGFTGTTFTGTTFTWTKPNGYIDSNMTVLLFLRQATVVTPTGYVSASPSTYVANTDFSQNGTRFLNDTNAKCIYNGDGTTVSITGLAAGTIYYVGAYVIRSTDSNYYSNLTSVGVSTTSMPVAATGVNVNGSSQTTATINWTRPAGYVNNSMTTLVFVKKNADVTTVAHPTKNPTGYTAVTDFNFTGSTFQYDSLAKCVMNTDSNYVNITGLTLGTNYHALVYVVRTTDSVYSTPSIGNGLTYGTIPPPTALAKISFTAGTTTSGQITWAKDSLYNDTNYTTLVFAKKGAAVTQGAPTYNSSKYSANLTFGTGTKYENDSTATCIFNGDGTAATLTGLTPATTYSIVAYVVRTADSAYSPALSSSATTISDPVNTVVFTGQSATSTKISWAKPVGYLNASYSTLVFVKADNPITNGTISRIPTAYTANAAFGVGTKYQNDTSAFCVFRADTNYVIMTNLIQNKTYYASIFVVRDADSAYSTFATGVGSTLPPPAVVNIGSINTTNPTTGNPDSLNVRVTLRGLAYGFNQVGTGLKFLMRDATGGITVLTTKTQTYVVTEGDSIEVQGIVGTNRGTVIVTIDTITLRATGKQIKLPTLATKLGEATENDLVQLKNVHFLTTPTGTTWNPTTYNIANANGDTMVIRVYNTSLLSGVTLPTSPTFNVIGIGAQVSTSTAAPFLFNGYQIFPRGTNDVTENWPDTLNKFHLLTPANAGTLTLQGDASASVNFTWSAAPSSGVNAASYTLLIDTIGGNFSNPKITYVSNNAGADTIFTISALVLANNLGLKPISTYKAKWRVLGSVGSFKRNSEETDTLTIVRNYFTGIQDINGQATFEMYPNPAKEFVTVVHSANMIQVSFMDHLGKLITTQTVNGKEVTLPINTLSQGVYFMQVVTENGVTTRKLLVN